MRFRVTLLVVGLLALVAIGLAGCSDDDTPTTPGGNTGITNTQYPVAKAEFGNTLDSTVDIIQRGMELAANTNTGGIGQIDDILFGPMLVDSMNQSRAWHVLYGSTISAGVSRTVIDSVQYSRNGLPQLDPQNADKIILRHTIIVTVEAQGGSSADMEGHTTLTISGLDGDAALINGSHNATINTTVVAGDITTERNWVIEENVDNVTITRMSGWTDACPTSGTVTATVDLTQTVNSGTPATVNLAFDVTIDNGVATVTATLGDQSATYTKTLCQL